MVPQSPDASMVPGFCVDISGDVGCFASEAVRRSRLGDCPFREPGPPPAAIPKQT
jgi:hypothetical protein